VERERDDEGAENWDGFIFYVWCAFGVIPLFGSRKYACKYVI